MEHGFKVSARVPWGPIMKNHFECSADRAGLGGHFAEKFVNKYCSKPKLAQFLYCNSVVVTVIPSYTICSLNNLGNILFRKKL